jgi:membrane fusion protein (multidrug efflux system)
MAEEAVAGDPQQAAYRVGYRTGFGDGFDAADKANAPKKDEGDAKKEGAEKQGAEKDKDGEKKDSNAKDDDKKDGDNKDSDKKDDGKPPIYKRPLVVLIVIVVVLALIIAALLFWRHSRQHESTDDAFVDGQASRIAAQAAGRVVKLYVNDNQEVRAGDPLIEIDTSDVQARVDQAHAQLTTAQSQAEQAEAQLEGVRANAAQSVATVRQAESESARAEQDVVRFRNVDPDAVSKRQSDSAYADARSAKARLDAARASANATAAQVKAAQAQVRVAQANIETARANNAAVELQLSYTHVVAPIAGRVTRRSVDVGNVISIGQPLLAIVSNDLWVTANYKETQLTKMTVGQVVDVKVDAFPDVSFSGHVDSIQRGTGSFFSMLPAENATGNYVKVVQRVPVKIRFDRPEDLARYAIGPGMSVKPDVQLN